MSEFEATASLVNQCILQVPNKCIPDDLTYSSLEILSEMLYSDRYELRGTALESLFLLTDPHQSGIKLATAVSHAVLHGTRYREKFGSINELVLRLALTGKCFNNVYTENELRDHACTALSILAQSINFLHDPSAACSFVNATNALLIYDGGTLADLLLRKVQLAHNDPHAAYLAAHILAVLCRHGIPETCRKLKMNLHLIQHAYRIGSLRYAALENTAKQLFQALVN